MDDRELGVEDPAPPARRVEPETGMEPDDTATKERAATWGEPDPDDEE